MPVLNLASAEPATPTRAPHPGLPGLAEGCLRRNPYLALRNVSCDCRDGVLVLRGCLPSYHLKQVAREVVARLEGAVRLEHRLRRHLQLEDRLHVGRDGAGVVDAKRACKTIDASLNPRVDLLRQSSFEPPDRHHS